MRGCYTAQGQATAQTSAKTLLYITAPSNKVVEVLDSYVTTNGSNTTNQQARVCWQKIGTLGTPTATSVTPTPTEPGDQAAGSTVAFNVTASEPTYTAGAIHGHGGWSTLGGYQFAPVPENRFTINGAGSWGLRLLDAITSADLVVNVTFVEKG